MLQQRNK